jgi:PAS domain S-box-containing protein
MTTPEAGGDRIGVDERSGDLHDLRDRAEELLGCQPDGREAPRRTVSDIARDLAVHRIEVDLQRDELLRARDELDQSALRYANLYDFAPSGIMSLDADMVIIRSNLAAAHMLRTERARLAGRSFVDFIAPDDREEFRRCLGSASAGSPANVCELDMAVATGVPVSVAMDVRRSNVGGGWEIAFVDMSEARAAQREIGELARIATREEIGRRLHDTVLQRLFGVSSSLQALLMGNGLDPAAREVVERMVEDMHVTVLEIWHTVFAEDS